jgi:predicted permease
MPALLVLFGAVGLVLLIACANVTSLLLARAVGRQSELAVRTALGAPKLRIFGQLLTESLLLAVLGGGLGLLLAVWATDLLIALGPADLPRLGEVRIDGSVIGFALACAMLTTLLVGLLPALQTVSADLHQRLQSSGRSGMGGGRRARRLLVVVEVALALLLLVGAGLLIRSFALLQQVDPGFDPRGILTFDLWLPDSQYAELHQSADFYARLIGRLSAAPGVASAAAVFGLPLSGGQSVQGSFEIPGRPQDAEEPDAGLRIVTSDYFRTLRIPLRQGRLFDSRDGAAAAGVAIINEAAARRYWPDRSPIGQSLRCHISLVAQKELPRRIVGVVGDVRFDGLDRGSEPEIFLPHAQHPVTIMAVLLRSANDPNVLVPQARAAVRALDSNLPLSRPRTMEQVVSASVGQRRFSMLLLAAFAALALLLAAVGIHGVLACAVEQRTQEIGVRMALGAPPRELLLRIVGEGLGFAAVGAALGLAAAIALTRLLSSLLYGVSPTDPITLALVAAVVAAMALLASYLPARRAARVDPTVALRYE